MSPSMNHSHHLDPLLPPTAAPPMAHVIDDSHYSPLFLRLHSGLVRNHKRIVLFWCLVAALAATQALYYVRHSLDIPSAPTTSRAYREGHMFAEHFPVEAKDVQLIAVVSCADEADAKCHATCSEAKCGRNCEGENPALRRMFKSVEERMYAWSAEQGIPFTGYQSYYNFSGSHLDQVKCSIAAVDGRITFAIFTYSADLPKDQKHKVVKELDAALDELTPEGFVSGLSGLDPLGKAGADDSERQVFRVDMFTMPVAFALFSLMVRSYRLLMLCLMNAFITVVTSFGALALITRVSKRMPLSVNTQLVEVIALAMSIDYALFLLRRYRDEIKNGRSSSEATKIMLSQAGHVVALSSFTFSMVFMGFVFLPSNDLATMGQACVVTVLTALAVAISNTVAMLSLFPDFFSVLALPACVARCLPGSTAAAAAAAAPPPRALGVTSTGLPRHRRGAPYKGAYFTFLRAVTKWPLNVVLIVVVYGAALPLALNLFRLKINQDPMSIAPSGADAVRFYEILAKSLPGGLMGPFSVVLVPRNASWDMHTHGADFYGALGQVTEFLSADTHVPSKLMISPALVQGRRVSHALSRELLNPRSALCAVERDVCAMYEYAYQRAVNVEHGSDAVIIQVIPDFSTFSPLGMDFVRAAHKSIDAHPMEAFHVLLCGIEVDMVADIDEGLGTFPIILAVTTMVIFTFIGVGFQSAFVPVRLSLTVVFPLATVYGLAVLVYQDGLLDWTGVRAVSKSQSGSFFWIIPILTLFISIGLVLDYDVFIVHRILEHRSAGYDVQASIIKAVWEVNSTIVVAGLIMCAVFSGLLLSSEVSMDQFGWLMSTSVLCDTFIVQTLLVPAIMSLGDRLSWWPRKMPLENLITLDDEEFED